jgi:hypothetical protein
MTGKKMSGSIGSCLDFTVSTEGGGLHGSPVS